MFVLSYHHRWPAVAVAATMAPAIHKLKYIQTKESCESLLQYQILLFNYLHPHRIRPFQWSCVVSLWILRFSIDLYMYINLVDGRGRWYGATHRYHTALYTLCLLLPVAVTATIAGFFRCFAFLSSIQQYNIGHLFIVHIIGFDHFTRSKHFYC